MEVSEITHFALNPALTRHVTNEVSFLTNDNRLIIITELNDQYPNVPQRELLHYSELVWQWLAVESSTPGKLCMPMPEFYVVHNDKIACGETRLSFGNDFLQVSAKLIDISFEKLPDRDPMNALAGYSYFCSQLGGNMSGGTAFDYAVRRCINAGYLKGVVDTEGFITKCRPLFLQSPTEKESTLTTIRQGKEQIKRQPRPKNKNQKKSEPEL